MGTWILYAKHGFALDAKFIKSAAYGVPVNRSCHEKKAAIQGAAGVSLPASRAKFRFERRASCGIACLVLCLLCCRYFKALHK